MMEHAEYFLHTPVTLTAHTYTYTYMKKAEKHNPNWYYLPTPPLGQNMTQGQFLSGV